MGETAVSGCICRRKLLTAIPFGLSYLGETNVFTATTALTKTGIAGWMNGNYDPRK
jgi:hypothetical protein